MCGICGFVTKRKVNLEDLNRMNITLAHRGPDDHGEEIYSLKDGWTVGFGHRRLSIIDLSERGHQPMHTLDGRISIIFNGEIYNYKELKKKLADYPFRTQCDTEVLLAAYLKWGIDFVNEINGMFAIALLDRSDDTVYLLRDRIGKKPLFYCANESDGLVFGSELKALMQYPYFRREVNKSMVGRFLSRRYLTAPDTMFMNTYKLEPGSILRIHNGNIKKIKYWDVAKKYSELKLSQILDYSQAKKGLKQVITESILRRMIADVPVGAFISGGYDSTVVCAIAQEQLSLPLNTFCIGFENSEFDEAVFAKKIAKHIGSNHEELYITEKDVLDLVDSIPEYYDEPFADPSLIPTMLVSALAKEKVSVVLSGDGGDELFGGYDIYTILQKVQRMAETDCDLSKIEPSSIEYRVLTEDVRTENKTQTGILGYINWINQLLLNEVDNFYYEYESKYKEERYDVTRMLLDTETRLPDYILVKVDRASMKYALECRCPFLDKDVVEYTYRIPQKFKNDNGTPKKILKDIAYDYIPRELLDRPKRGFAPPIDQWLRGPLKQQLIDYTNRDFIIDQAIFDPDEIKKFTDSYLLSGDKGRWSGKNYSKIVWPYFTFQQWYCRYMQK